MSSKSLSKHICMQSTGDVAEIASSLFTSTPINYFSFGRYYKDGGTFFLNNDNSDLLEAWLLAPQAGAQLRQGSYLWHEVWPEEVIRRNRQYDIKCGLSIVQECPTYTELISFGSNHEMSVANYFLNNKELSTKFGLYFKDQASSLIEQASNDLIYPEKKIVIPSEMPQRPSAVEDEIYSALEIKTYHFNDKLSVSFTPREKECFELFLRGDSSVAIGQRLGLSQKTVQSHLKHIKDKFNCRTNSELIAKLWSLGALKSDFFV